MIKRSAPLEIQSANMETDLSHLDTLVAVAKKKWGTKAFSLMTIPEIKELVHEMAAEEIEVQ